MPSTKGKLKTGKVAGRVGGKAARRIAPHAGRIGAKNAVRLGKMEAKLIRKALSGREPRGQRYFKYGLFILLGVGVGALLARSKGSETTWGGGSSPAGSASSYSKPSDGPLIGSGAPGGGVSATFVPEQSEEAQQKIRTALGEDERTKDLPRVNVEVNDGIAELRGVAPTDEVKRAAAEVAAGVEGVREVRNLLTVA